MRILSFAIIFCSFISACSQTRKSAPVDIGTRLELFVDDTLVEGMKGVVLTLHSPLPAEKVMTFLESWEGPVSAAYVTVFKDNTIYRMYYRGEGLDGGIPPVPCYAESTDGIHWVKPSLNIRSLNGGIQNNIILERENYSNFAPFKDPRPDVPESQRYKALAGDVYAYSSPDGIHWKLMTKDRVLTNGSFDSQNVAFWDSACGCYRSYFRIGQNGFRAIGTATSTDFIHWTDTLPIDLGKTPLEHLYTNATMPYFRAPHFFFSFPMRYQENRGGVSDAVFMSSRDGVHFDRRFLEAWIRPGPDPLNWTDRNNMPAWGIVQTSPSEMSVYYNQHYRTPSNFLRRGIIRLDGFVSAHGNKDGILTTKLILMRGNRLKVNVATAAAGAVKIELQDKEGRPIPGYSFEDSETFWGDEKAHIWQWKGSSNIRALQGVPIKLSFKVDDGDLYSYQFEN